MLESILSHRNVNEWNKLSADSCAHTSSTNMFKKRIDNYLVKGRLHLD